MTDIISSLKRLERAGLEHSRTTEKLKLAALQLDEYLSRTISEEITDLPRNYRVAHSTRLGRRSISNSENFSVGDSRAAALSFARDLAEGWLDELEGYFESDLFMIAAATTEVEEQLRILREIT